MESLQHTPRRQDIRKLKKFPTEISSPLRRSIVSTSSPRIDPVVNDDEAERARRRTISEFQKRVSNIGVSEKPTTSNNNANDADAPSMSEAYMEDHYQTCVKLFAENKITAKNAWNIHIIEFMTAMLHKGGITESLKFVSTSLDISSKVYGLRVDDIHNEIFKLAGNMAKVNVASENDEEAIADEDEDTRITKKKKERSKQKRSDSSELTIAKDDDALNGIVLNHNTQVTGNSGSAGTRLYNLTMYSRQKYGWEQLVNCRTNFKYWIPLENSEENKPELYVDIQIPTKEGYLCPSFQDFTIDQWSPDDDDVPFCTQQSRAQINSVVYDENGIPIPELDASIHEPDDDDMDHNDFFDNNDEEMVEEMGGRQVGAKPPVAFITDMRPGNGPLSDKPLQYSYREAPIVSERYMITGVWAGPSHWKLKCLQRGPTNQIQSTNINGVAQRAKRTIRKVQQVFNLDITDDELKINLVPNTKKEKRHQRGNLEKCTLPEDMSVSRDDIETLNLHPWIKFPIARTINSDNLNSTTNLNVSSVYQYDNPNDAEYCSQNTGDDNDIANDYDNLNNDDDPMPIDAPCDEINDSEASAVQKIQVPYATRSKQIDMKKLKDSIWKSIFVIVNENDDLKEEELESDKTFSCVSFKQVYKIVPKFLSTSMAEDLSIHLCFVALLHLCNERTLLLEGSDDLTNVFISRF